ncbi:MAG: helix-turn-helix transcriptional regulator [Bacilli bacterium]|nr:helix-turn-helix transcriptional regulator [Bacilli bacterium]
MENLKKLRNERNITQVRLSIAAEVSQETISAYESGKALPSADTLIKIADFLDVSIDYLLDRTDNPIINTNNNINEDDKLLNLYHQLNKEQKKDIITYIEIRKQM